MNRFERIANECIWTVATRTTPTNEQVSEARLLLERVGLINHDTRLTQKSTALVCRLPRLSATAQWGDAA